MDMQLAHGFPLRRAAARLGLLLALVSAAAAKPEVVIFRGTIPDRGEATVERLGDLDDLSNVRYAQIGAVDLLGAWRPQLKKQAEFFLAAQRAAGWEEMKPLPVILDPAGDWAFARSRAELIYTQGDEVLGYTGPVLILGEKRQYQARTRGVDAASGDRNQAFRTFVTAAFTSALQRAEKPGADFAEDVLKRTRLTRNETEEFDLFEAADILSTPQYLKWLEQIFRQSLERREVEDSAVDQAWESFRVASNLEEVLQGVVTASIRDQVATSVSHEMGHVVHFVAVGAARIDLGGARPHMEGGSHTLQTLSSPEFAFVEGWAAANSMVTVGTPEIASPGAANRIDYSSTGEVVTKRRNRGLAQLAARRVAAAGQLEAEQPLTVPPFTAAPEDFREKLRTTLTGLGWEEKDWADLLAAEAVHPELAQLVVAEQVVSDLQARKGELRSRYDFLRSEYAVGSALAALRVRMGMEASWTILATMAKHAPTSLGRLLEAWVADNPTQRMALYRAVAEITEGILISPAEIAALEAVRASLELDIDRDGSVPGTPLKSSLGAKDTPDPLKYDGEGDSLFPQDTRLDPPATEDRLRLVEAPEGRAEAGPSMDDLFRR